MLAEWLQFYTTPCSIFAREMGYVREAIAIQARYRRCKHAWRPHLEKTKEAILQAAERCEHQRVAVMLGAGNLYDIPLKELCAQFERVILVDIVFLRQSRKLARVHGAECVEMDVTGMIERIYPVPPEALPNLVPPPLSDCNTVDLVVSVNLLSQLPMLPKAWLKQHRNYSESAITAFCKQMLENHLRYLQHYKAQRLVVTDIAFLYEALQNLMVLEEDALYGITLPSPDSSWMWNVAPAPEVSSRYNEQHAVAAFRI